MTGLSFPINIVLADDHEIYRDGFKVMMNKIPSVKIVGEASDGLELIEQVKKLKPDVVVTDIKMPKMDGIEATRRLTAEFPYLGIIALSMYNEESLIVDMLEAGAKGYLIKNTHKNEVVEAVSAAFKGESYYCRETTQKLAQMIAGSKYNPYKKLAKPEFSDKEITVMKLICQECSNQEIANQMILSKRTVEGYREKILEKINAKNSVGIVIYAIRHNIYKYQ